MLRHLTGLALAVGLAAAIFFGGGWGVAKMIRLAAESISLTSITGLSALGILLLVGLFLGILMVVPQVSPLSTAVPGAVLLAWTALLGLSAQLAARIIPLRGEAFGAGFHSMLVSGVLAVLGTVMICPVFVPSRWRPDGAEEIGDGGEDETPSLPASPSRLLS
ncbi:MAG TPA: hypothetical protein VMV92_21120 [Streptosporangiaceae bacterium]|nr:hypothetical protein [Streptosporangiaceae bacterium]